MEFFKTLEQAAATADIVRKLEDLKVKELKQLSKNNNSEDKTVSFAKKLLKDILLFVKYSVTIEL